MSNVIRTRLVKIGNSQGIRIPKMLLDQLHLDDDIELEVQDSQLIIRAAQTPRATWAAAFQAMAAQGDDTLLDADLPPTAWEASEWEW
ncbi:MazE family transcriptional regulator [Kouleothrix aurantiaca]|uniref:MazE family transcriptional regulator n=1 Tax=Kouleothrix aurantiaca TaxID=186479 RepID=A0A0P9DTY9_9CHLR|nr:MazE family transcriptional regulator [Kouleothrix aurantiaca]